MAFSNNSALRTQSACPWNRLQNPVGSATVGGLMPTTLVDARSWSSISYCRARMTLNMRIDGRSQMPRVNLGPLNAKLVCIKL